MKTADGSECWNKTGFKWISSQNWACDKLRLKCFENGFSSFPPCFRGKRRVFGRLEHRGWNRHQKTRLQIIIDLLTLFPASDFLPLPKQTTDTIYFLGYSRFAVVRSARTAYLLTRPHLRYVTSAAQLRDFIFSHIQKWTNEMRERKGRVHHVTHYYLLINHFTSLCVEVSLNLHCSNPFLPQGGARAHNFLMYRRQTVEASVRFFQYF